LAASPVSLSMKADVPDRAMVPRFSVSSFLDMPMPLSAMVMVPASLSTDISMPKEASPSKSSGLVSAS